MKRETAHLIEALVNGFDTWNKKVVIILSDEIKTRPNAISLTRGKNGYTKCVQYHHSRYDKLFPEKYREYTDDELIKIVDIIRERGVYRTDVFGNTYRVVPQKPRNMPMI